jgi:hypothetical protein
VKNIGMITTCIRFSHAGVRSRVFSLVLNTIDVASQQLAGTGMILGIDDAGNPPSPSMLIDRISQ